MAPPNLADLLARDRYENMDAGEWAVIQDWLRLEGAAYDRVACNVRLGDGRPCPRDADAWVRAMWKSITQIRADVVVWHGVNVDVIEAKVEAHVAACGQVMNYRAALVAENIAGRVVRAGIICRRADSAVDQVMAARGGFVVRVPGRAETTRVSA